ncbi:MAG: hypothetical protein JKY70_08440 [Mucilaginibacter sp.]|nr:hypothetical protein [Mucilaginibacter sp.]
MIPAIPQATTLDEVIEYLTQIINHSIEENDRAGYFAALYYKVTVRVKQGVESGQFGDGKISRGLTFISPTDILMRSKNGEAANP